MRGATVARSRGRGLARDRYASGRGWTVPVAAEVEGLLAEAVALYRATSVNAGTFTDGDAWPNEGTAGGAYDAVAADSDDNAPTSAFPHFVTSPSPGFEITALNVAYYFVPNGVGIEPGAGSFTAFGMFYWPAGAGSFDNAFAKIETPPEIGSGGKGWQVASGSALGSATFGIASGGGSAFQVTDPKAATQAGNLASGEHLVALRLDRGTQILDLFIDGVKATSATSMNTVASVTAVHEWIFGRGKTQTNRAYGLFMRALTDAEITVDLADELGYS